VAWSTLPLVLKRVSEEKARLFKAEAARRGLTPSQAFEEAVELWLRHARGDAVTDVDADDEVWRRLRDELRRRARGKYVVLAEGRLVGVYSSLEEAAAKLRELRARGVRRAVLVRPGVDDEERGAVGEWLGGALEPA